MNENPLDNAPQVVNPLPNSAVVFRAATDATWFYDNNTKVDAAAFIKRSPRWDANGLSIGTEPYFYRDYFLKPINGIISVNVGKVREVVEGQPDHILDVLIDNKPHGNITGLPFPKRGLRRMAERLASLLARQASKPFEVFDPPRL